MNVAVELAKDGNNVAIIDFDLEAPGLQTFDIFLNNKLPKVGLLEFVDQYINSVSAGDPCVPEVNDFLCEASPNSLKYFAGSAGFANAKKEPAARGRFTSSNQGKIWLMPARGKRSSLEPTSIDWTKLYQELDGFYLMEELKARLREFTNADYLLIDSRTGFSDHSRICTNQLADALAVIYFPNEQNLIGLEGVIKGLRQNKSINSDNLRFVASRVPTGDDEASVLENMLVKFEDNLKITHPRLTLHQNYSFGLLKQELFSITKTENTQLFNDYVNLTLEIETLNPKSRRGTLIFFDRNVVERPRDDLKKQLRKPEYVELLSGRIASAAGAFRFDEQLNFRLAQVLLNLNEVRFVTRDIEELETAAFYHAAVGYHIYLQTDESKDVYSSIDDLLVFHFHRTELSFADINSLTLAALKATSYKPAFIEQIDNVSASSSPSYLHGINLDEEIMVEPIFLGAVARLLAYVDSIESLAMEEQAPEPYLIALLYEFFDLSLSNKKGSELELGPRQYKILSASTRRRVRGFVNRFFAEDEHKRLKSQILLANGILHFPFLVKSEFDKVEPYFRELRIGGLSENVSEENFAAWGDFAGDESLSTSSQFIGIFMLNLLLFFSNKEKEDWLDDTPIAAFLGMSLDQDDLHGHLCKLVISQLANHHDPGLFKARVGAASLEMKSLAGINLQSLAENECFFSVLKFQRISFDQFQAELEFVLRADRDDLIAVYDK